MIIFFKRIFYFIFSYLSKKVKVTFFLVIGLSVLVGLTDLASIFVLKNLSELKNIDESHTSILIFMGIFTFLFFLKTVQLVINRYLIVQAEEEICSKIIKKTFENTFIDTSKNSNSSIINLITYEAKRFSTGIVKPLNLIISGSIVLFIIIFALIFFGYVLTLLIGSFCAFLLSIIYFLIKKKYDFFNINLTNKNNDRTKSILEILNGIISIKSFKFENFFLNKFIISNKEIKNLSFFSEIYQQLPIKIIEISVIFLIFSVYMIDYFYPEIIPIKLHFFVYFYAFYRTYPLIKDIYSALSSINNNKESYDQIRNYLENQSIIFEENNFNFNNFSSISYENLSIYRDSKKIIDNFSLIIKKNETLGIHGKSGVGKTSIALAISALIDADYGNIFIDKLQVDKRYFISLRHKFIYLSENPFLISATLKDNLFIKNIDFDEVTKILNIMSLENLHLDYLIDVDRGNLSYGQKQKISILRSILHKPSVLILDEALNGIDLKSIERILDYIKNTDITLIIITHNMKILDQSCDRVVSLD